ncbi:hypothetical protein VaNZ11_011626 [Volvox africanus]|uniref:Lon N-terminal domain-containing protein n=1 Tax=Volvox africanus TaxID=51714 RepID=A0ABQ5SCZ9_9CHLO|nr:hypothetical protein VaNZ11_011626 [Volvox africanus]
MRQVQSQSARGLTKRLQTRHTVLSRNARSKLPCRAAAVRNLGIPHELPLFPVQPMGVFLPGMTKTLHLYEPHFISLMDECLASEHKLMATAVLEPFMGEASEADAGPGAFVGGYNFSLSCGCLVQVLSAKPYTGGYLVRIRGEARLGISGLPQAGPYMRAQVYPLPDQPFELGAEQERELRTKVAQLREIMRDVQNLASKFRCDETAALQQAMRWMHGTPIAPGIQQPTATHGSPARSEPGATVEGQTSGGEEDPNASVRHQEQGRRPANKGHDGTNGGPMAAASPPSGNSGYLSNDKDTGSSASNSGFERGRSGALSRDLQQAFEGAAGEQEEEAEFSAEEAVRLSWASLQWLPHASTEERMFIVRTRLLAMETRDVGQRVELALEAMGRARASLAAKCAIKAI